jgi:hypothetical protein
MTNTTLSDPDTTTTTPSAGPPGARLVRLALPAGLVAAAVGVPSDLYHFTIETRAADSDEFLFQAHGLGLVTAMVLASVALLGLALRAGPVLGRPGRACVALAYVGTLLVLGSISTEAFQMRLAPEALDAPTGYSLVAIVVSYGIFAVGWFGVALALGRHELVSPGVTLLICLGALYAFTPFPGSYILLLLGIAAAVVSAQRSTEKETSPAMR